MKNNSDYNQYVKQLVENGMSEGDAKRKAVIEFYVKNPALAALGGAISGTGFGAVGTTGGYINTKNEGARLNMTGEAGELINSASDGRYGDRAAKMAQDIQLNRLDGKQAKDIDVGNLQRVAAEYLQNQKEEAKKNAARAKRAETMENIRTRAVDFADGVHNAAVNFSDGVHNAGAKAADSVRNVFRMRGEENTQEQHTPEQLKVMYEYENAVDSELLDFVRYAKENPSDNKTNLKLNSVSDRLSKDIKNAIGIDVSGFIHAIKSNTITHINNEHGENGTTDHSMADEKDIARIKYVLENYDTIERLPTDSKEFRDKNQRPAPTIKLSKRIDGTMYVVEAVPDTKKGQLPIISAYKTKAVQQTGTVHAPSPDAQSASADTAFNNTISQTKEKSNTQSEPRFRMRRMYDDTLDEGQKKVFEREAQGGGKYNATATAQTEEQTRAQTTAQKFGHRVVFYEGSDNGFIKDGTVYISKDAENPVMSVLGHELTHAVMADESIKKELISFVRAQTISENGALKGDYSDRFNQKKQLYQSRMENVTDDYILEEITADIGGDLFMSDEFINRITEEKPNIAVRIWRSIKDFIARVTGNGRYKDLSGSEIKQLRNAAKAAQKYEQAFIKARENMTRTAETKYSPIERDGSGRAYVRIEENILDGISKKDWGKKVRQVMLERFSDGIEIENGIVKVTSKSRNEYTNSKYTQSLYKETKRNKFNMSGNLDEIINSQSDITNESPKHQRKDNFVSFNRGKAVVQIGNSAFTVDVVTGNTKNGEQILYDIVNIKPTTIKKDTVDTQRGSVQNMQASDTRKSTVSSDNSITENGGNVKYSFKENENNHKNKQFDIIASNNPAQDDYHTWIRNVDEIKTLPETIIDDDWVDYDEFNPDYTREMAEEAIKTGKITVYSSYPIEQGIFVTPSRMEAESYSGNGQVYSKEVDISDVAWIDPTQGQYARIDKNNDIRYKLSSSQKAARFNSIADKLIAETGTTLERGELSAALEDIYNTLSASDYSAAAYAQALEDLKSLSRTAFENTGTVKDDTLYKENADLRRYLRTTAIAVNDSAKEDFGSKKDFNDFRRANFGRIRISNSGTPVDIIYKELSEMYPQFFDENREMTQSDQLKRIAEVLDSIKPVVRSAYEGADIDALADCTADELFSSMLGVVGENAETGEKKKKVSRFRTNTIERAVMFTEEDLKNISPQEFEYMPETEKQWSEEAVRNVSADMRGVMEKIRASDAMQSGVMAQEAALISKALTDRYRKTGSAGDLAAMTDWLKVVSERTRETARALKATDSAWEKSPAAAVAKAQSVVQAAQEQKEDPKSKTAKGRKVTSKKHAREINKIQDEGVERIAEETEKAFGKKAENEPKQEAKTRTTKRQRIESRTLEKFNITKEKEPNKAAFVSKVLSDLFGKISSSKKSADSGAKYSAAEQPKLDLWYSDIKAAIEGRGEYAAVWEEMYALAREEYAGDAQALAAIDDYFTNGKKPIIPLETLDRAINDAFSQTGTSIGDVVRDYFSDSTRTEQALSDYIIEKTGVSSEDAAELAKYVRERYRETVEKKQIQYLEREAAKLDRPHLVSEETKKRVSRHIDGVFSEKQAAEFENDVLKRTNPKIAKYARDKGINLLDVVKHGVCDSETDNYKYLDELFKELDGQITKKDIKDFSEAAYREFAKMPQVRADKVLSRYFKIDEGGMIVTRKIGQRTVLGDMLGLIDIAGEQRAGVIEEILKRNDGLVTLEQSDINAILNHMRTAAEFDKDSREYRVEIARVKKIIEGKKQPSSGAAVRAYARINMLLNPKTILTRNAGANLIQSGVYNAENIIGAGIDKGLSKETGIRTAAMPSFKAQVKGAKKGISEAIDDFRNNVDTRGFDGKYDIGEANPFKGDNVVSKTLDKLNRTTGFLLDAGDRPFYEAYFADVLNQQMKANGVSEPTEDMITVADMVALERTWQDSNVYTETFNSLKKGLNAVRIPKVGFGLGDAVMPFVKTPANLLKATVQYSPAGLAKAVVYDLTQFKAAVKNGTATPEMQRRLVDNLSKGIVGAIVTLVGYALSNLGLFEGEDDDDDRVKKFRQYVEGRQANALNIGNSSISLSWLQPLGGSVSFGATLEDEIKKDSSMSEKAWRSFTNSLENLIDASLLQGVREFFSSDYETMGDKFIAAAKDAGLQMLPLGSLTKQLANSIDNTVRTTYAPTDGEVYKNRVKQYYPGFSNTLEPRLNALGEQSQRTYDETPDKVSLADGAARVLNSFFNPANTRRISSTPLIKELNRVYDMTGDSSVYPSEAENKVTVDGKDYRLTSEQYTVYQRKVGTKIKEVLNALIVDDEKAGKYAGEKTNEVTVTYAEMTEEERKKKESSIKTKAAAEYKESIDKKDVKINDLSLDERTELKRQQEEAVERFRNGEEQTKNVVWSDVPYSQLDDGQKAEVLSSAIKKAREAVKEELKEDWTENAQPVFKMKG